MNRELEKSVGGRAYSRDIEDTWDMWLRQETLFVMKLSYDRTPSCNLNTKDKV